MHQRYSRQALYTYDVHENRVVKNVRKVQLEATVFWVKKAFVQSWSFVAILKEVAKNFCKIVQSSHALLSIYRSFRSLAFRRPAAKQFCFKAGMHLVVVAACAKNWLRGFANRSKNYRLEI